MGHGPPVHSSDLVELGVPSSFSPEELLVSLHLFWDAFEACEVGATHLLSGEPPAGRTGVHPGITLGPRNTQLCAPHTQILHVWGGGTDRQDVGHLLVVETKGMVSPWASNHPPLRDKGGPHWRAGCPGTSSRKPLDQGREREGWRVYLGGGPSCPGRAGTEKRGGAWEAPECWPGIIGLTS